MSLEDKIKALLEGTNENTDEQLSEDEIVAEEVEEIVEDDEGAQNAKITAGKGRKLDADKVTGAPSTDEPNNKKNHVDKNPQGVKEHMDALTDGEELSEEFKVKAAAILEAAIADGISKELTRLEEEHAQKLDEAVEAVKDELVEQIDGYLNVIVEKWVADNELAVETGVRTDIVENFIDGLKNLFKESYIDVPEEKYNVLDEQAEKIDELTSLLSESIEQIEGLTEEVTSLSKLRIMESIGDALTDTEYEKFAGLCEGVTFESSETFEEKIKTIKENYFPKTKRSTVIAESDTPVPQNLVEGTMSHYVNALAGSLAFKRN